MTDLRHTLQEALSRKGDVSSDFDLNPDISAPDRPLAPAGVLIGISEKTGKVLLTKRAARLKHHPGQIAFPGGRQDPTDPTPIAAALREAQEETGLPQDIVAVLGSLPCHQTVTHYHVTPVVGLIGDDFDHRAELGEVSEIFEVPLDHLLELRNYRIEARHWQGRKRYYYAVPFGPYYIWGATARILRGLAERMS